MLLPQGPYKLELCGKELNSAPHNTGFSTFNDSEKIGFETNVGRGEKAGNQHFLLFSQCFLPLREAFII